MITIKGKYNDAIVMIDDVESTCLDQIRDMVNSPAFDSREFNFPNVELKKDGLFFLEHIKKDRKYKTIILGDFYIGNRASTI